MTPQAPVTVYWRPGCGFCHILRRDLDRAGLEPTETGTRLTYASRARHRPRLAGRALGDLVTRSWIHAVETSLAAIKTESERRSG